jgi:hypothetical protein
VLYLELQWPLLHLCLDSILKMIHIKYNFIFSYASYLLRLIQRPVGRSRVWFPMVSLEFFIDIILLAALWLWVWPQSPTEMSTRNFPGSKVGRCVGLTTLPLSCADFLKKSGSLNLREKGPIQACNGIVLPLPLQGSVHMDVELYLVVCSEQPIVQRPFQYSSSLNC